MKQVDQTCDGYTLQMSVENIPKIKFNFVCIYNNKKCRKEEENKRILITLVTSFLELEQHFW